jgi:peptidoglycan/xylan/chitin deacetylase (PgdA/CDA1 family)
MRERVAGFLHRTGALEGLLKLRASLPVPTVSIITYHHVADHDPAYPYDPDVADATPAQFRWQMEALAKHCTPIGIDELLRAIDGAPLPKNAVMVTFDDGYLSCHDTALPILRAVGIRATFFIATSYVGDRRLYWWERVALLVRQGTKSGTITYPSTIELAPREPATRKKINDLIKDSKNLDLDRFLDGVAEALGVPWTRELEAEYAQGLIMTWDHVRALSRAGMDIESHSRSHRVLQTLDAAGLVSELAGSRADLEEQLGRPIRAIAYPVGRRLGQGTERIREAIGAAGYRIGLTNASGINRIWPKSLGSRGKINPLDIHRLSLDRSMSDAMFLTQIAVPRLSYYGRHED